MAFLDDIQINWETETVGHWKCNAYGLRIVLENGRYKPSRNGTFLVVGGLYSLDAAKLVCQIILNDIILNRLEALQKAA